MSRTVYVAVSSLNNKVQIEGVFSTFEGADHYCDVKNSTIEEFRKDDDKYTVSPQIVDEKVIPDDQCCKKYWDYSVFINKDSQTYGKIVYSGDGIQMVHVNKLQDVEIYDNEYIYCRSYVSKKEAENIVHEQWQLFEQKQVVTKGV